MFASGQLKRYDDAYKREKDGLEQLIEIHTKEMDKIEAKLVRLKDTTAGNILDLV